jgi:hypothetical protein
MGIDINLNLKTINGQTLTGAGDIAVNSLNWRGEFASAPSMPKKNDAYHNTTIGNSYIFNGSIWQVFAQKGEDGEKGADGENGSSGMYFPHETLTIADIGKLVIWKDGKAQLPVFEEAQDGQNEIVSFTLSGIDLHLPNYPVIFEYEMTTQPTPEDTFTFNAALTNEGVATPETLTFVVSASASNDVEIGATIADTVANLVAKIVAVSETHVSATNTGSGFTIQYGCLGLSYDLSTDGEITLFDDIGSIVFRSCISLLARNDIGRVNGYLVGFFILKGMKDAGLIEGYLNDLELFNWYFSDFSIYTESNNPFGTQSGSRPRAEGISEHKAGLVQKLKLVENIITAYFEGNILYIEHTFDEFKFIAPEDEDLFVSGAWSAFSVEQEASSYIPSYCRYPILGLIKSVGISQVEIHTEPICEFTSVHDGIVSWETLMDLNRIFILNPDAPGYLMSVIVIGDSGLFTLPNLTTLVSPGYVAALDNNIESLSIFRGVFSVDLFTIQIFFLLSSQDEGGIS